MNPLPNVLHDLLQHKITKLNFMFLGYGVHIL